MITAGYSTPAPKGPQQAENGSASKRERNNYSMTAKKISNGWVVRECWEEGDGEKRQYKEEETFHAKNPIDPE